MSKITDPKFDKAHPPDDVFMCAWCWEFYTADTEGGEYDKNGAWSCPECIADGANDPRWLLRMLGFMFDDESA